MEPSVDWVKEMAEIESEMKESELSQDEINSIESGQTFLDGLITKSENAIAAQKRLFEQQQATLVEEAKSEVERLEKIEEAEMTAAANLTEVDECKDVEQLEASSEIPTRCFKEDEEVLEDSKELEMNDETEKEILTTEDEKEVVIEDEKSEFDQKSEIQEKEIKAWREQIEEQASQLLTIETHNVHTVSYEPTSSHDAKASAKQETLKQLCDTVITNLTKEVNEEITVITSAPASIDCANDSCFLSPDAVCLPLEFLDPSEKLAILQERFELAESFCGPSDEKLRARIENRFEEIGEDFLEMETRGSEQLQRSIDSSLHVIEDKIYLLEQRILDSRPDLFLSADGLMPLPATSWRCCNVGELLSSLWF